MSLIKIEGKPLEKLIDVISNGIGKIYTPKAIRKEADAKAYEIEVIERAKSKAIAEGKEIEAITLDKIEERLIHKEIKRQINIDNVTQIAEEHLYEETYVSEEPVNEDWTTRFFNIIEDVSDQEMQQLWGKILAGEVKEPKSFSLRTLETLKNLSKNDAEIFIRSSNLVISSINSPFLFKGQNNDLLEKYQLNFEDKLLLTEIGILQPKADIARNLYQKDDDYLFYFESGKYLIKVLKKANSPDNSFGIFRFTKIGEELLKLIIPTANQDYIRDFVTTLESFGLEVEYSFIINKIEGNYTHTQPWLKFNK